MRSSNAAAGTGRRLSPAALGALARATLARLPLHAALIGLAILWLLPVAALLVSSFRDPSAIATSGWWEAVRSPFDFTFGNYDEVLTQRTAGDVDAPGEKQEIDSSPDESQQSQVVEERQSARLDHGKAILVLTEDGEQKAREADREDQPDQHQDGLQG